MISLLTISKIESGSKPEQGPSEMDKPEFRELAIRKRNTIPDRDKKSQMIFERLKAISEYQSAQHVFIYLGIRSEVQTQAIVQQILDTPEKSCYVPYCVGDLLKIFRLTAWKQLTPKSFGVLEPTDEQIESASSDQSFPIELALLPGVAFDRDLNRIGYGRGYFDRFLTDGIPDAHRIALAFDDQITQKIPTDEFDVPVHRIVTESETIG